MHLKHEDHGEEDMSRARLNKLEKWITDNIANPEDKDKVDFQELGSDLTLQESIEMLLHVYPTLWTKRAFNDQYNRLKQIVFVAQLIEKIKKGQVQVTYRRTPKHGLYYGISNRFKPVREPRLVIEVERSEEVNPYELSDSEANLAGVESANLIREMFMKWYGNPIPRLYRNWFKVVSSN